MEVKLFIKEDCPDCPAARRACDGIANLSVYDVEALDGLAEASSWDVLVTPSVVIVDSGGREVASWRGRAPDPSELRALLGN